MMKPLSILLVEDSEDDALLLIRELKKGGYEPEYERVETAEAMRAALCHKPRDVILCDYQMPQFNGLAAIALLKDTSIDIPLIIVSGTIGEETAVECMRLGARDYIMKSNLSRLAPAIERELKEAESRRQRERAEEALRKSESIYWTLIKNIPQKIFTKDKNSLYVSCNEHYAFDLGITPEEIKGTNDYVYFPKELADKYRADDIRIMESETVETIEEQYVKGQQLFWVQTTKAPLRDAQGNIIGVLGIFSDITKRKQADEERKVNEERLAEAQSVAKIGSWETNVSTLEAIWSKETYRIFDIDPDSFRPSHPGFMAFVHPEDRVKVAAAFTNSFNKHLPNVIEHRIVTPGGFVKFIEERWQIFHDAQELPVRAVGTCQDITDRILAADDLRNSLYQLQDARDMLVRSDKLAAIGTLAAGVTHEILNPLNVISLYLQMWSLSEIPPDKMTKAIQVCQEQVERIVKISGDLNQFARVGSQEIKPRNINHLIDQTFNLIAPKLHLHSVTADLQLRSDLPPIPLDQNALGQVFLNLVNNAIDAMEAAPVKVLLVSTELVITAEGELVRVVFADRGTGISEETISKIFDPFFTTKALGKGTGLGLSISYRIIQDHGGSIRAENNEWGGASFSIELPVHASSESTSSQESGP